MLIDFDRKNCLANSFFGHQMKCVGKNLVNTVPTNGAFSQQMLPKKNLKPFSLSGSSRHLFARQRFLSSSIEIVNSVPSYTKTVDYNH